MFVFTVCSFLPVCARARACVCVCVCARVHVRACMCVCVSSARARARICAYTSAHACVCVTVFVCSAGQYESTACPKTDLAIARRLLPVAVSTVNVERQLTLMNNCQVLQICPSSCVPDNRPNVL